VGGGEARFPAPVQTGCGAQPASYTMGTGSFPGVNRPGGGVDHPSPSSAEVKERAVPLLPHWAFVACYRVNFTFTFTRILSFCAFVLPPEARGLRQVRFFTHENVVGLHSVVRGT